MRNSQIHKIAGLLVVTAFLSHCHIDASYGIIGSDDNLGNVLYLMLYLAIIGGSSITKLSARGMRYVMYVAALIQLIIPTFILMPDYIGYKTVSPIWDEQAKFLTIAFTVIWLFLSVLFLFAERREQN